MEPKSITKEFSFGGGQFDRQSPPREKLSPETPILNIEMSLEEALKLSLALEEGCRKVNRYKKSTAIRCRTPWANARASVSLYTSKPRRIIVYEGKSKKSTTIE